jgi:hypothetical protein
LTINIGHIEIRVEDKASGQVIENYLGQQKDFKIEATLSTNTANNEQQ